MKEEKSGFIDDLDDIARVLIPEIITQDQLYRQERESGEVLLLREILKSAVMDLRSTDPIFRHDAREWLLENCGVVSLKMCLEALNIDEIWFRGRMKKLLLSNDQFGVDNGENKA